jgi:thymidylate synthase
MFSVQQKREISEKVQQVLRETGHPELPEGEIEFHLHVKGTESWSWADIKNNAAVQNPGVNPWNEKQAEKETDE